MSFTATPHRLFIPISNQKRSLVHAYRYFGFCHGSDPDRFDQPRPGEGAKGLETQASTHEFVDILNNDVLVALEAKYGKKADFVASRDGLVHSFGVKSIRLISESAQKYSFRIQLVASGEVPKVEGFSYDKLELTYQIDARQSYGALAARSVSSQQ